MIISSLDISGLFNFFICLYVCFLMVNKKHDVVAVTDCLEESVFIMDHVKMVQWLSTYADASLQKLSSCETIID